jgi:hypothetical protein
MAMIYQPRITELYDIKNKVLLAELLGIPEGQPEYVTAKTLNSFLDEAVRHPADPAYQDLFLNDGRCDADKRSIILAVRQNDQRRLSRIFSRQRPSLPPNFASENFNFFTFLMDGFCEEGEVRLLEVVVLYTMVCSWASPYLMQALLLSMKFNQIEVIRFLLGPHVLDFQYCFLISDAIAHSVMAEVNAENPSQISDDNMALLLSDDRIVFEFEIESHLLGHAARLGKNAVLDMLLQNRRGDPNFHEGVALRVACRENKRGAVHLLLADERVDFVNYTDDASLDFLKYCAAADDLPAVRLAVGKAGFRLDMLDSKLAYFCGGYGGARVLEFLLREGSCNPAASNNAAVRASCSTQELECIRLLLADPRVDPTVKNNKAIRRSVHVGRDAVTALLISHRSNLNYVLASLSQHPLHLANVAFVHATLMEAYRWTKRYLYKYPKQPVSVIVKFVTAQLSLEQRERGMGLFKGGFSREEIDQLVFRRISALVSQTDIHDGQYSITLT